MRRTLRNCAAALSGSCEGTAGREGKKDAGPGACVLCFRLRCFLASFGVCCSVAVQLLPTGLVVELQVSLARTTSTRHALDLVLCSKTVLTVRGFQPD